MMGGGVGEAIQPVPRQRRQMPLPLQCTQRPFPSPLHCEHVRVLLPLLSATIPDPPQGVQEMPLRPLPPQNRHELRPLHVLHRSAADPMENTPANTTASTIRKNRARLVRGRTTVVE
jgi:hypothetical protein